MFFDLAEIAPANYAKLLNTTVVPRPIAWLVTKSASGELNAAPFSYFNVFSTNPPIVGIGIGSREGAREGAQSKDSSANILATRQFVVNLVSYDMRHMMNICAADYAAGINEIEKAGLATVDSVRVDVPRIAESPAALECAFHDSIDLGNDRHIITGRVLAVHVRDDAVIDKDKLYIDTPKLDLIGRLHGRGWYARLSDLFEMPRVSVEDVEEQAKQR
ncbi:flavin reductase family protein [Microbaculum marinisediminis]|uniref:Flavin reductase family protein n=1 Tax=Microbaculum marinisediminis TaxID=2931392 RepID=A0AAW5QSM8_9HYPH|nr:flavin reductase family protein [Microbaculum sp. A6E488]MCT8970965.1 flavin reductase family protein [Microbaculum sp. A6E488]